MKVTLVELGEYNAKSDQHGSLVMENSMVLKNKVFDKFFRILSRQVFFFSSGMLLNIFHSEYIDISSFCDICGINDTNFNTSGYETGSVKKYYITYPP